VLGTFRPAPLDLGAKPLPPNATARRPRHEAEEFIFTDASGNVSNKRQDLAGEKDCHKSDAKYDVDDTDVRLYPASAVVTGRITITKKDKEGKVITRRSRFTDVFVWRDATWQLVAGHSSRIPDTAAQR